MTARKRDEVASEKWGAPESEPVEPQAVAVAEPQPAESGRTASVLDEAVRQAAQYKAQEEAQNTQAAAALWRRYFDVLTKPEAAATAEDARDLASIMLTFGLSRENVEQDRKLIERARALQAQHAQLAQLNERRLETLEKWNETRKRVEVELFEASRAKAVAEGEHMQASQAAHKLELLRRQRPQLFKDTNPPQLLTTADE